MTDADWIGFGLAVLLIELTPGPNMAWLAALAMGEGRRAGLAATAGVAIGLFVNALAAALGIAFIVSASPLLWQVLRWGGAAFLLWLAWESWRDAGENSPALIAAPGRSRHHFLSGLVVNLLNPKAMLFYVVVIPRFNGGQVPGFGLAFALALVSHPHRSPYPRARDRRGGDMVCAYRRPLTARIAPKVRPRQRFAAQSAHMDGAIAQRPCRTISGAEKGGGNSRGRLGMKE